MPRSHSKTRIRFRAVVWALFALSVMSTPSLAKMLEVLITPRPPYYILDDQISVRGIVAGKAVEVFSKAELEHFRS